MDNSVKKLYKEAQLNQEFNTEGKELDPIGFKRPDIFSDDTLKHVYAAAYYGWLLAKGEYKRENYH